MPAPLAGLYMFCLATEIEDRTGAPLVTDQRKYEDFGRRLALSGESGQETSVQQALKLLQLDLAFPTPEQMSRVPMKKFLKFHRKWAPERRRLRRAIEAIASGASKLEDPAALEDFFADKRQDVTEAVTDMNKSTSELGVKSVRSLLSLQVPATTATGATLFAATGHSVLAGLLGAAGLAVSVVDWVGTTRGRSRKLRERKWYYLRALRRLR
jgi:hypothetical protein